MIIQVRSLVVEIVFNPLIIPAKIEWFVSVFQLV